MSLIGTKDELVRMSYANVWEPKMNDMANKLQYSIQLIIPKKNKAVVKQVYDAIDAALKKGLDKGKITSQQLKSPSFKKNIVKDGDEKYKEDEIKYAHLKDCFYMDSRSDDPPKMYDKYNKQIPEDNKEDFYSGCWGRASLVFYVFAAKSKTGAILNMGVTSSLVGLQKVEDGERFDGKISASDEFEEYADIATIAVDNSEDVPF